MVNKKTAKEETALMLAVDKQHAGCVRLLLERGADPDLVNKDGETPLNKGIKDHSLCCITVFFAL